MKINCNNEGYVTKTAFINYAIYYFSPELNQIENKKLVKQIIQIINSLPFKNIIGPASSTGKYHSKCSNGEYGLCHHTKLVVANVITLLKSFPCKSEKRRDNLIAAALLHDFCKYSSDESEYVERDHAHIMAKLLQSKKLKAIAKLVDSHMGRWNEKTNSPVPKSWDEKILHIADMLASQRYINAEFDKYHNLEGTDYKKDIDKK
jgi:HD superfamily phosphohydrolase YqeK